MNAQEHKLMVYMFARQTILIQALFELLKSRDVAQPDDVEAFESLVRSFVDPESDVFFSVASQYESLARVLGLRENLPPSETPDNPTRP